MADTTLRAAIVGGGVTGLTAGYRLSRGRGWEAIAVLEAAPRPGGNVATTRADGFIVEHGPAGFLDNVPETLALARDLGLTPVPSNAGARKRFLVHDGALARVPENPIAFLRSPLLSPAGRLLVLAEPFARRRPPGDETVFHFAARRIGTEAAAVLIDAMVTGVFAGDSAALSLRSAFPKMHAMESAHGGLVRAMLAKKWARLRGRGDAAAGGPSGPGGVLSSFEGGFATLVERLAAALGDKVRTSTPVLGLARRGGLFELATPAGAIKAERVLLAVPAAQCAAILHDALPAAAGILRGIPAAPIAVAALAFPARGFPHSLGGFGFLVPRRERLRILGALWSSSIFPARAPEDSVLLTCMAGGARDTRAVTLPDAALVALVMEDLAAVFGPLPAPTRKFIFRYEEGIAQYPPGHEDRLAALARVCGTMPGLHLAGSSFRGISVNLCVVQAERAAEAMSAGP